jgi:hypothetical protein
MSLEGDYSSPDEKRVVDEANYRPSSSTFVLSSTLLSAGNKDDGSQP